MALDAELRAIRGDLEIHYASKDPILSRLRERLGDGPNIHEILMPTPIGGRSGPSVARSLLNLALPVGGPTLPSRIASYLRAEARLYDSEHFDLAINDGDMGSNVIASRRSIPCAFVTNQYRPRLYASRFYLRPAAEFIARQIARATRILVADSAPPNCICERNLNIPQSLMHKVEFVGHFAAPRARRAEGGGDLARLIGDAEFGYWMRTGDAPTNSATGAKYEAAFADPKMRDCRRVVSHARPGAAIDRVIARDGGVHTVREALERGVDWLQIDVAFLDEGERDVVMDRCAHAVLNGSHTAMGEVLGTWQKPIVGVPIYDEHANHVSWARDRGLGAMARTPSEIAAAASEMLASPRDHAGALADFGASFEAGGARRAAEAASALLDGAA
ncbi:MAG: glycosyltransferase [Thaumarchaeota archaeon S13]|nr:MAG: glycosyltransferase [Thaumarchaeota archaeon S13]